MPDAKTTFYCSFCGKSQHEVAKLIAGPGAFICGECVMLCIEIVKTDSKRVISYPPILSRVELETLLGHNPMGASELFLRAFGLSLEGTEYENDTARSAMDHLYTTLVEHSVEGWTLDHLDARIKKIEDEIRLTESAHARLDSNRSLLEKLKMQRVKLPS